MTQESFEWDETAASKRLTVVMPSDTDIEKDDAEEAIRALAEDTGDETEDTGDSDASRRYPRGYQGGQS